MDTRDALSPWMYPRPLVEPHTSHIPRYPFPSSPRALQNVFAANVAKVQAHNAEYLAGRVGWTMAVNGFADMTASEFKERFTGGYRTKDKRSKNVNTSLLTTDVTALPASVGAYSSSHAS
jgi:hypothetical protein